MNNQLIETVFKGIAVAMGVAVFILNILGTLDSHTAITLLGIGLATLGIASLRKNSKE